MSLINQMLKDLEERRPQPGGALQQEVLHDVQALAAEEPRAWRRILFLGGLFLAFVSGFGWWGYRALQPIPAISLAAVPVARPTTVTPPAIASAAPAVPVASRSESREVKSGMPVATEVAAPATVEPPAVVAVTKVDRPLSSREQADVSFQRALVAQRAGERATLETELRQALEQDPSHFLARETLAAVLYRAGRVDEAKEVLRGGMNETSAPLALRKTLARILVDQGDPEGAALALLQGGAPTVAQETEFHQLLAAIYQRTGQFSAAAQTYRQLLGVQRKNGVWWLGLGLALESNRSFTEAQEAYRSALEDPVLQPELGDFARSRLAALTAIGGS